MKSNAFKIAATIFFVVLAIFFTAAMRGFGAALGGGGVGSRFFLFLVAGPEGLLLLVWPILAGLLPWTRTPKIALAVVILSLVHVFWAGIVLNFEGVQDDQVRGIWKSARIVIYIFASLFFLPSFVGLSAGLRGAILMFKKGEPADAESKSKKSSRSTR